MAFIQETTAKIKANPISTLLGGVAGFMIAKRLMKMENNYYVAGVAVLGAIAGAMVSASMKTKKTTTIEVKA